MLWSSGVTFNAYHAEHVTDVLWRLSFPVADRKRVSGFHYHYDQTPWVL